jgi:biotin carboxyl carrier protein
MLRGARSHIFFVLTILTFVVVPFLFWRGTWFGTSLTESQMGQYLSDWNKPRKIQHALVQIEKRMISGDQELRHWYPNVQKVARHPSKEVRLTAAWVMGQDTSFAPFHDDLKGLLHDEQPMVRRNAALSLVRFHDISGKPEILSMLQPISVRSSTGGQLAFQTSKGDELKPGQVLAKIQANGKTNEVLSPISGIAGEQFARTGELVRPGQELMAVLPDDAQLWEALRALFLVGTKDDLPQMEKFTSPAYSEHVRAQARETIRNIQLRSGLSSSR